MELASHHSSALMTFYDKAVEDGMKVRPQNQTKSIDGNYFSDEYVCEILSEYGFPTSDRTYLNTRSISDNEMLLSYYEGLLNSIILTPGCLSSLETLSDIVMETIDGLSIPEPLLPYKMDIIVGLFVLIDSYSYWVDQGHFGEWIVAFFRKKIKFVLQGRWDLNIILLN